MTVKMFITESKQIINNGKVKSQSISADFDGKNANIIISKNGKKQYAKLDKKDIHEILSLKPNKNNLLESLKKELKTKPNNRASVVNNKMRKTRKRKKHKKPKRRRKTVKHKRPRVSRKKTKKRKTRKTKKKSNIENLLSDLF